MLAPQVALGGAKLHSVDELGSLFVGLGSFNRGTLCLEDWIV
jgi:hypothetical protein